MPRPYTDRQYRALERSFARSIYLGEAELKELSQELGLSSVQLLNWFKNRRRRGARVYDTSRSFGVRVVRAEESGFDPVVFEEVSSSDKECKSAGTSNLSESLVEEDCDLVDWQEVQNILELVVAPKIIDERYICHLPRYGSIQPPKEWSVVGHSSNLDGLVISPRIAVWLKELLNAVAIDAPSIHVYSVCPVSGSIIWDQTCNDSWLATEPWYQTIVEPMRMKDGRLRGMGTDLRTFMRPTLEEDQLQEYQLQWSNQYAALHDGDVKYTIERGRERHRQLLQKVVHERVPNKFDESCDPAVRCTTGNKSIFSLPVIAIDGTLEGVVWIGTRHPVQEPALNAFMDSVALSLRSTCRF